MSGNPFRNQPIYARTASVLMRDINRIEASLNSQGSGLIDIMIVIDTSGSMNDVINAVKQNVRFIFDEVTAQIASARIGLVEQGDWYVDSVYRCQPTSDTAVFQAAINAFGNCGGSYEAYVDSLIMAVQQTQWRAGATRLVIIIGDESANQQARSGKTWSQAIDIASAADVIVAMIIAKASAEYYCRPSYSQATEATGGVLLVAPTNDDVVDMIILMIGYFVYDQTEFFKYTPAGKQSLGMPDGGVSIPSDNALANTPLAPNPIIDMRNAVLGIVNTGRLKAGSGQPFNWTSGSADNLYRIAMGDRTAYGATGGIRYTWTRTLAQMPGTAPYDIDIGEVHECVRVLKVAAGV